MHVFEVPLPPTANKIWRSQSGRVMRAGKYLAWQKSLGWCLKWQRVPPAPIPCRLSLVIVGGKGWRVSNDIDNRLKPLCDGLVEHKVLESDDVRHVAQVEAVYIPRRARADDVRCFVKLGDLELTWLEQLQGEEIEWPTALLPGASSPSRNPTS